MLPRLPVYEARPSAYSDTLTYCIIPVILPITSVQVDLVMTVMGNKGEDSGRHAGLANSLYCQ